MSSCTNVCKIHGFPPILHEHRHIDPLKATECSLGGSPLSHNGRQNNLDLQTLAQQVKKAKQLEVYYSFI